MSLFLHKRHVLLAPPWRVPDFQRMYQGSCHWLQPLSQCKRLLLMRLCTPSKPVRSTSAAHIPSVTRCLQIPPNFAYNLKFSYSPVLPVVPTCHHYLFSHALPFLPLPLPAALHPLTHPLWQSSTQQQQRLARAKIHHTWRDAPPTLLPPYRIKYQPDHGTFRFSSSTFHQHFR